MKRQQLKGMSVATPGSGKKFPASHSRGFLIPKEVTIMNDQKIEDEIVAKGKTAPRVTPEHIQSLITGEYYFSAENGVNGNIHKQDELTRLTGYHGELKLLTFCVLVLKNGFTVTGESACASPENFDEEIGRKIARQNAVNKIWMLEGYLLKEKLSDL